MTQKRWFCTVLMMGLFLSLPLSQGALAQEPQRIDLETMNDPSFGAAFAMPMTWWLEDNTAIVYDLRKPDSVRVLERLDPVTGKRTPMLDWAKAKESFAGLFPAGKAPRV